MQQAVAQIPWFHKTRTTSGCGRCVGRAQTRFSTRTGTFVDTSNILHRFQEIFAEAGIDKMRFYDLRHTHASLLIAEGVHTKKIAERLGHASIKLTMDLYGHLFDGSDKESADRMQKLFGERQVAPAPAKEAAKDKVVVFPARRKLA